MTPARGVTTIPVFASLVLITMCLRARARTSVYSSDVPCGRHGVGASRVPFHPFTKHGCRDAIRIVFVQNQVAAKQQSESVTHSSLLKVALLYKLCQRGARMPLKRKQACLLFGCCAFPQILKIGVPPTIQHLVHGLGNIR